jgi:monovalent cation:H+ antiporter-2, CPA2 family
VLFFVSVGMLFEPRVLVDEPVKVLAVVAIIVVGKSLAAAALVLLLRYPLNTALTVAASLAQIGEFSFILAGLGMQLGVLPAMGHSLILAGALISIALNRFVFTAIGPGLRWIRARSELARRLDRSDDPLAELPMSTEARFLKNQVVLVGYGRLGQGIAAALRASGVPFVVAEANRELVEQMRREGQAVVLGDAVEPATLIQAHIAEARMLVIATPEALDVRQIVETARTLNPTVQVVLRGRDAEEAALLERDHAGTVFIGDQELARAMTRHVIKGVGEAAGAAGGDSQAL